MTIGFRLIEKKILIVSLIFFLLAYQNIALADVLISIGGNKYVGKITSMSDKAVEIETSDGKFQFQRSELKDIQIGDYKNTTANNTNNSDIVNSELMEIEVPSGLVITYNFKNQIKGNEVQEGDIQPIIVHDDIYVKDLLVFPKG